MPDDDEIVEKAHKWIKAHHKKLIDIFCHSSSIVPDEIPTTIFMAGSPGAGKTEFSRNLADTFEQKPVLIDADEIRKKVPGYSGKTAYLYQKAANKGVNILYDYCCNKGLNVILDGTFAYAGAIDNVQHSLKHKRNVEIYYLYQDPLLSWSFTKIRERSEYRRVPKDVFITAYLKSMENVKKVKDQFGPKIKLNIVVKDFTTGLNKLELNKESIDSYISKVYTYVELESLIK